MPERNVRSSLRRSWSPGGILVLLCLVLAPSAWSQTPTPDPPPSGVAPDPPPDAVTPPPPPVVSMPPAVVTPPPAPAVSERAEPPARPAPKPEPTPPSKPKPEAQAAPEQPAAVDSQPRDSSMPRAEPGPLPRVLERSRLVLAGLALVVVALGGAVVLGVGRRALVEASA